MKVFAVSKRKTFAFLLAAGTLLLLVPLTRGYGLGPYWGQSDFYAPLLVYLLVPMVYAVSRYGNARFMVLTLGVLLLLFCAGAFTANSATDPYKLTKMGAAALGGVGLLLGLRWAAYVWYALALVLTVRFAQFVHRAVESNWMPAMATEVQTSALVLLIVGVGGSAAVATYFRNRSRAAASGEVVTYSQNLVPLAFGVLCAVGLASFVGQWQPTPRFPDTTGVATLHESLRGMAMGGSERPQCDKISYCGNYVELSCHPEVDGQDSFFDNTTGAVIMRCGGACMMGRGPLGSKRCEACPPPEWSACASAPASSRPR